MKHIDELSGPFQVEKFGHTCFEIRNGNGIVVCWAANRAIALIIAGLLERNSSNSDY